MNFLGKYYLFNAEKSFLNKIKQKGSKRAIDFIVLCLVYDPFGGHFTMLEILKLWKIKFIGMTLITKIT